MRLVVAGFAALFAVVAIRAGQLTVLHGQRLARLAHRQQHRQLDLTPLRGPIVDGRGEPLALTIDAESLYLHPGMLRGDTGKIVSLADALGLSPEEIRRKTAAAASFVWLKRLAAPREVAAAAAVGAPGVGTLPEARRVYPRGSLAAHVLGVAGIDAQGLEGVERFYDTLIRPPAQVLEVDRDALGQSMFTRGVEHPALPIGARVELTIDATLQALVERGLRRGVARAEAPSGSVVVLDPWTGAVVAMANVPTFDPNDVAATTPAARRNRAITDTYEPGSTLKALVAAAALDRGVSAPADLVFCEHGRYEIGRRAVHDHRPRGWLTFAEVVQYSSNIGTVKVAETLGGRALYDYLRAFGLGEKTGIDLPGEVTASMRPVERWAPIDLATASFGQGLAVTPLQLARAFAAIANGGLLLRPYVVRRVVLADGTVVVEHNPEVVRRVVKRETAATVAALLRRAVEGQGATGRLAQLEAIAVAGKTGTAQKFDVRKGAYSSTAMVASFAGFVPVESPRLVILVVIDEPKKSPYGGVVAAPVFREIAGALMARIGVEKDGRG
jgi:cell division protein FtsI (penicillin-binding protein 3)